jgi:enterochelin esterase family protein
VEVPLPTLDSYVGRYKLPPDDSNPSETTLALFRERGHLLAQFTDDKTAYEVFPATPVRFFCKAWGAELTFEKDGDGHVTGLTFENNGKKSLGKKISNDPQLDGPGPTDAGDLASSRLLSPRLAALASQLKSGDKSALDRFWQELQDKGPLTEPIADDPKYSWVTFMWRGNSKTWRVHLRVFFPPTGSSTQFALLPGTDLWYRTERIPNDARFAYIFRINCDEAGPEAYAGRSKDAPLLVSRLDPLNPREVTLGKAVLLSLLEMPAAARALAQTIGGCSCRHTYRKNDRKQHSQRAP